MKKIIPFIAFLYSVMLLQAQDKSLYDVNYDKVNGNLHYDAQAFLFQEIYLQYEKAITTITEKIREEEKSRFQDKLERIKEKEQKKWRNAVEKTRKKIYFSEINKIRAQALNDLKYKIREELQKEISAEYEVRRKQDLKILREELKLEVYKDVNAITQWIKIISFCVTFLILFVPGVYFTYKITEEKLKIARKVRGYQDEYFEKIKKFRGNTLALFNEIPKIKDKNEQDLRRQGIRNANEKYKKIKKKYRN